MSDNCTVAPANGRITGTQIRIVAVVSWVPSWRY